MAIRKLVAAAVLLIAVPVLAESVPESLAFRVLSEDGAALSSAVVLVGNSRFVADDEGNVSLLTRGEKRLRVRVTAQGHYSMVHTVTTGPAGAAKIADVHLVREKAGRHLMLFAGDSMLGRRFFEPRADERILVRHSNVIEDGQKLLRYVKPYVELADIASVNLETQLSSNKLSNPVPKSVTFYSPAELAELLEWTGFDYVALGNNHTFDYRDAGIRSTMKALEATELGYSGAGFDEQQAREAYTVEQDGQPFSYLSYVGWPGNFTPTQSASGAKGGAALGNGDVFISDAGAVDENSVTVLQHHSGIEYAEMPSLKEVTNLRTAVDAGVDVAIGHHSHVLQGLEIYRDRLIAYSMGNFLFDQYIYSTQAGMLLFVWMDGDKLHRAEIVPLNINGYVPTPATGAFRYSVLNRIARLSMGFGTCMQESGSHAVLGDGIDCVTDELIVAPEQEVSVPISLWQYGLSPLDSTRVTATGRQYRFGIDLLPRGDFESAGLFGVPVRAWQIGKKVRLTNGSPGDGRELRVSVAKGERVRTGMKVFERAFSISNPVTASGRIRASGDVTARFYLQRRLHEQGLTDALTAGPLTEIGSVSIVAGKSQDFSLDHALPRQATKSVRLLIDFENNSTTGGPVDAHLDDLAWVEWRTPWLNTTDDVALHATHVQWRHPVRLKSP